MISAREDDMITSFFGDIFITCYFIDITVLFYFRRDFSRFFRADFAVNFRAFFRFPSVTRIKLREPVNVDLVSIRPGS
jgi:hypothetical protein